MSTSRLKRLALRRPRVRARASQSWRVLSALLAAALAVLLAVGPGRAFASPAPVVRVQWKHLVRISRTVPTTQHLGSASTLRRHPLNKALLGDLRRLHTNDTRVQLWYPLVRQAVAELRPPTRSRTFWDFRYMDQTVVDFFANTIGRHHVNIGTIPEWMFDTPRPVSYPTDPGATDYNYEQGAGPQLKDPSGREFAQYEARVFEWYTKGGFTDELGRYHRSGYHFKIDYWGVLNEPSLEHSLTVQEYTRIYDAVTAAIRRIDRKVQFFGPELAVYSRAWTEYFLNPRNHGKGARLDWFSLHDYPLGGNNPSLWQTEFFTGPQAYGAPSNLFAKQLRELLRIRDRLSPHTKIALDEQGTFNLAGGIPAAATLPYDAYKPLYWVASGANFAANFITADRLGIELISMTQTLGYPTQSESTTMVNWETGRPNPHYWTLKLLNDNFGPGNRLVATTSNSPDILAQAAKTRSGRKVLLVNTSNAPVRLDVPAGLNRSSAEIAVVDARSGEHPPRLQRALHGAFTLAPFATAVAAAQPFR